MQQARLRLISYWSYGVAAVAGAALVALAGCTLVGDRLTGVDLSRNGKTSCIKDCNDAALADYEECKRIHEEAREQCKVLPEPERTECLVEAGDARTACMVDANADKETCQNSCHRQGSGSAG